MPMPTMMNEMPELRPCPLCGGQPEVLREAYFPAMSHHYFVACRTKGCGIETARIYGHPAAAAEVWNRRPVSTNADYIRAMTDTELADSLHEVGVSEAPWEKTFSKAFCDSCGPNSCEFDDDCPHGRPVDWWLGQRS